MDKIIRIAPRTTIIVSILKNHKGRMLTITNLEKDGSVRTFNGRLNVKKGTKDVGLKYDPASKGYEIISEVISSRNAKGRIVSNRCQFRTVNLNTLQMARMNGVTYLAQERILNYSF